MYLIHINLKESPMNSNVLKGFLVVILFFICLQVQAKESPAVTVAVDGMIVKPSLYSVTETLDRLEKVITEKGITVFTRVDHAAGGKKVDIPLRSTQLLIFGNPKLGTLLMQSQQSAGIDLPLKALAWEDENGKIWLGYNEPSYIASRHGITDQQKVIDKISAALQKFTDYACGQK